MFSYEPFSEQLLVYDIFLGSFPKVYEDGAIMPEVTTWIALSKKER